MNKDPIITMPPPDRTEDEVQIKSILQKENLQGSVVRISPGAVHDESPSANDRVVFVIQGEVMAEVDELFYLLGQEEALQVEHGKSLSLRNRSTEPAKIFHLDLPTRTEPSEPLLVFPGK